MSTAEQYLGASNQHKLGLFYVFMAGAMWSTIGLGIRLIKDVKELSEERVETGQGAGKRPKMT